MTTNLPNVRADHFFVDFMLGGISAGFSRTLVAPFDRIKLLLQTQDTNERILKMKKFEGIIHCARSIKKHEGTLAFWRGNVSNIIRYLPAQALNFAFNNRYKKLLNPWDPVTELRRYTFSVFLSGGLAGATTQIITYPLDLARTLLAADIGKTHETRHYRGTIHCLKKIYRHEGPLGIYRGFNVSMAGVIIYRGIYFGGYDVMKQLYERYSIQQTFITKLIAAKTVTIIGGRISYPIDTVKRRLMMQSGMKNKFYLGTTDCIVKIFKNEGIEGFYKGSWTNVVRSVGAALTLVLFDLLEEKFGSPFSMESTY